MVLVLIMLTVPTVLIAFVAMPVSISAPPAVVNRNEDAG